MPAPRPWGDPCAQTRTSPGGRSAGGSGASWAPAGLSQPFPPQPHPRLPCRPGAPTQHPGGTPGAAVPPLRGPGGLYCPSRPQMQPVSSPPCCDGSRSCSLSLPFGSSVFLTNDEQWLGKYLTWERSTRNMPLYMSLTRGQTNNTQNEKSSRLRQLQCTIG